MNVIDTVYSEQVLKSYSDKDLYETLYKCWGITNAKIEIWGELKINSAETWSWIAAVRTIANNRVITYPVAGMKDNVVDGVFISNWYAKELNLGKASTWIKCELELSSKDERKKQNNSFHLQVKKGSAEHLKKLHIDHSKLDGVFESDAGLFISDAVFNYHTLDYLDQIENSKNEHEKKKEDLSVAYQIRQDELDKDILVKKEVLNNVRHDITSHEEEVKHANSILEKAKTEYSVLNEDRDRLENDIRIEKTTLVYLSEKNERIEQEMARKIDKLKSYISDRALFLKDFEFMDEEDFDSFFFDSVEARNTDNMISFKGMLDSDYSQAVSYIQAYLKERDILYPRHVIENYLTLIRSNDLIILAGDSGSGKTNLVQSFAKAVGGVSRIVPVKPNWTSSEDLLGYYNPLEKKYLATPFLEALIEAQQNPEVPYFICLDEMNLARVEFYFADFLSKLEDRENTPEIQLFSDDESAHVLSELKNVIAIISDAKEKHSQDGVVDFVKLMQNEEVNKEIKNAFGFSDKDSLIKYHGDIRRMLSGIMSTPSTISIPANVRIIGAVNIDETTHYLSPKVLDRAHIMKFKSPLLADWDDIFSEIESYDIGDVSEPLYISVEELGLRGKYPKFDREVEFCEIFIDLNRKYFDLLGIDFGMRTIRQGLSYSELFKDVNSNQGLAINNFILFKVLPKLTFDGNKQSGNTNKLELLENVLLPRLEEVLTEHESIPQEYSCIVALRSIVEDAKANDGVVNYWA